METPYPMRNFYTCLLSLYTVLFGADAGAQYCSPTFANGCFGWNVQSISLGAFNWSLDGGDCSVSDYTTTNVSVAPGDELTMSVTTGIWCGCAVWVDGNDDGTFTEDENLYYNYVGGDPGYTYTFPISIPLTVTEGQYRMRIIAPWGSDGFLDTNTNGFGPCGDFQYGNVMDLTIAVSAAGVAEIGHGTPLTLTTDPAGQAITVASASALSQVSVLDIQGRVVDERRAVGDRLVLDTRSWSKGVYVVRANTATGIAARRVVVE